MRNDSRTTEGPCTGTGRTRFRPPPGYDAEDRPNWALPAPGGARWVEVPDGDGRDPTGQRAGFLTLYAPRVLLPALRPQQERVTYGRPVAETTPARLRLHAVAVLVDLFDIPKRRIARRELTGGNDEARRKQTYRDHGNGRRSLHGEGVLPWAAWPSGQLPDGEWWKSPELGAALTEWSRQAALNPSPAPPTLADRRLTTLRAAGRVGTSGLAQLLDGADRRQRAAEVPPWRYEETAAGRSPAGGTTTDGGST